jgi:serine/threonine protein kinase
VFSDNTPLSLQTHFQEVVANGRDDSGGEQQDGRPSALGVVDFTRGIFQLQPPQEEETAGTVVTTQAEVTEFHFSDLYNATNKFDEANVIGRDLYRGELFGTAVAVKTLPQPQKDSNKAVHEEEDNKKKEEEKELLNELALLVQYQHANIIGLLGVCPSDALLETPLCLVCLHMPGGTVRDKLNSRKDDNGLTFRESLSIAIGAARGLRFLHEVIDPPLIHRDIRSANLLLDEHLNVRIGYFGLIREHAHKTKKGGYSTTSTSSTVGNTAAITTNIVGNTAYMAPEYLSLGEITPAMDVFSLAVVYLELLAGRPESSERSLLSVFGPLADRGDIGAFLDVLESQQQQQQQPTNKEANENRALVNGWPIQVASAVGGIACQGLQTYRRMRPSAAKICERLEAISTEQQAPRVISLEILFASTEGFALANKIGEGGGGTVYRGKLEDEGGGGGDGYDVAVKQLTQITADDVAAVMNEVTLMQRFAHPNLLGFVGYCPVGIIQGTSHHCACVVSTLMSNGSVFDHLVRGRMAGGHALTASQRAKIALDAARGLHFLHTVSEPTIVHRDIKSSNILLDTNFCAKIGDFGIARESEHSWEGDEYSFSKTNAVVGTRSYMAPEYLQMGEVSPAVDVYGLGLVLLELMTGRHLHDAPTGIGSNNIVMPIQRAVHMESAEQLLVDVARYDTRAEETPVGLQRESPETALVMSRAAVRCLQPYRHGRPSSTELFDMLRGGFA